MTEKERFINTYIEAKFPTVIVHNVDHFLRKNTIQTHKKGGQNAKDCSHQGKVNFSLSSHKESSNDHSTTQNNLEGSSDRQQDKTRHDLTQPLTYERTTLNTMVRERATR